MEATIRLDVLTEDDAERLRQYLVKYTKYLVYEEIADKTEKLHYQGIIIFHDDKEFTNAKVRFSTYFPNHSRGKKSMSKVKKSTYAVYITKDGKIFASSGYTDGEIESLRELSYQKTKEKVIYNGFANALEYCKGHEVTASSDGWQIASVLIDYYREKTKCEPNDFQLRNMSKSIQTHLVYEHAIQHKTPSVYENYKNQRAKEIIGCQWVHPQI